MPITFGSVGDILAVSLLVKDIIATLDDNRGSADEVQELTRELVALNGALSEIQRLSRQYGHVHRITALLNATSATATGCQKMLQTFNIKLQKYEAIVQNNTNGSLRASFPRAARKLQWALMEKDETARFRADVQAYSASLNMLLTTINV